MLSNFEKYFFPKTLSFLGYFSFFIFLICFFVWLPEALEYSPTNLDPDMSFISLFVGMIYYSTVHYFLATLSFVLFLFEYFLKNKNNKQVVFTKKQKIVFWAGIFLVFFPLIVWVFLVITYYLKLK